ncbi:histone-like nucleoid-structuring protein Lsr2 [Kocuria flava]|uniref:histone-like nucleoid-structuring protein Lsr2 n=1 Tax=Kocuria flava TaxID=446860 RepID=UPI003F1B8505
MAQKVEVHLEDDLDGGPADHTVSFALDGRDYEIDLSDANAERLRDALRPFVAASRKAPVGATGRRQRTTGTSTSSGETAAIRAWAKQHGHQVSDRGRIYQTVKEAYYAATGQA